MQKEMTHDSFDVISFDIVEFDEKGFVSPLLTLLRPSNFAKLWMRRITECELISAGDYNNIKGRSQNFSHESTVRERSVNTLLQRLKLRHNMWNVIIDIVPGRFAFVADVSEIHKKQLLLLNFSWKSRCFEEFGFGNAFPAMIISAGFASVHVEKGCLIFLHLRHNFERPSAGKTAFET